MNMHGCVECRADPACQGRPWQPLSDHGPTNPAVGLLSTHPEVAPVGVLWVAKRNVVPEIVETRIVLLAAEIETVGAARRVDGI